MNDVGDFVLNTFEELFATILRRSVKEQKTGLQMKLKETLTLEKALSVVDKNASESLLGEATDILISELQRYLKDHNEFYAMDHTAYLKIKKEEEKSKERS